MGIDREQLFETELSALASRGAIRQSRSIWYSVGSERARAFTVPPRKGAREGGCAAVAIAAGDVADFQRRESWVGQVASALAQSALPEECSECRVLAGE
jgi:hypothetical protein